MSVPSGRWIALQALLLMEPGTLGASDALEQAWAESGVDLTQPHPKLALERGLALELTLGFLRWERRLMTLAGRMASRGDTRDMHPAVRILIGLGLYQLMFLDRIPPRAAVSATVELTRPAGVAFATSFVNANLRRFAREGDVLSEPKGEGLRALAERWSHPRWFVKMMDKVLGDEQPAFLEACQREPPLTLRVNRLKCDLEVAVERLAEAGVEVERGRYSPDSLIVQGRVGSPTLLPGFAEGWLTVQDEASQVVGLLAAPPVGGLAIDACAAPGGKTAHLAQLMGGEGTLWAVDASPRRLRLLSETLTRLGVSNASAAVGLWGEGESEGQGGGEETGPPAPEALGVDVALVDAPCSAMGIVRRIPEVKRRRRSEELAGYAARQLAILEALSQRVAPGGALVYSVCSPLPIEGEGVIGDFLARNPGFAIEDPRETGAAPWHELVCDDGAIRTYPHRHGCDAFYAVRLRRYALS